MIDVRLTTPYKNQTHNNNIVHRVSGRKNVEENVEESVIDADGVGAGERVMEMESARTRAAACF